MAAVASKLPSKDATALKRAAARYNKCMAEADALRSPLDALVLNARAAGGTFREIATLAERSVAWVQGSLERSKSTWKPQN